MFNRIDWRLKTLIGFLQYTLHSHKDLQFCLDSCFSGGEYGAHFARILAGVGKTRGNSRKRKITKSLIIRGLAISFELNSYPEPGSNRHGLLHWCLRPTRLPIPPSGLAIALFPNCECKGKENLGNTHEESRFFLKKCRKKYIRASSKVKFAKEKPRQKKNRPPWL